MDRGAVVAARTAVCEDARERGDGAASWWRASTGWSEAGQRREDDARRAARGLGRIRDDEAHDQAGDREGAEADSDPEQWLGCGSHPEHRVRSFADQYGIAG